MKIISLQFRNEGLLFEMSKPQSTRFRPVVESIHSVLEEGTGCVRVFEMKGYDHFDFNAAPNNVEYKENAKFEYKILVWCTIPPPGV